MKTRIDKKAGLLSIIGMVVVVIVIVILIYRYF